MTPAQIETAYKMASIVMPHLYSKRVQAQQDKTKLVHYASAETALEIVRNQEIWLRDSRCMNDYQEVLGGARQIEAFFGDAANRARFSAPFDKAHKGAAERGIQQFMDWRAATWANTFLMSFSEHDPKEDRYGRLSMWRAYGRKTAGVALVMNVPMDQISDVINAFLSPAGYFETIDEEMAKIIENADANTSFLATLPSEQIVNSIFMTLTMAATCLKHPGFCEEREWRFLHLPKAFPSPYLKPAVVTIDCIPQTVYKMKLEDAEKAGIKGMKPTELLQHVIVGPTAFPYPIQDTFCELLKSLGFSDPYKRVIVSNIPIRT